MPLTDPWSGEDDPTTTTTTRRPATSGAPAPSPGSPRGSFQDLAAGLQFRHPAAQRGVLLGLRRLRLKPAPIRGRAALRVFSQ
jgi:hypothetical protein